MIDLLFIYKTDFFQYTKSYVLYTQQYLHILISINGGATVFICICQTLTVNFLLYNTVLLFRHNL